MSDPVNKPPHYTFSQHEPIAVIEEWGLGFRLGNTVKYIARAGRKDPAKEIEDLSKARWYLDREIAALKAKENVRRFNEAHTTSSFDVTTTGEVLEVLK